MLIRHATIKDLEDITEVEAQCFPVSEAATKEDFKKRLTYYPDHFILLFDEDKLISFVDGFVSDERDLSDEMYEKAKLHNEKGKWQMIFGVNTLEVYRHQGLATTLIKKMIEEAKAQNRLGVVLTCKKELIPFYFRFGFISEGISQSTHGHEIWYQMRITF